MMASWVVIIVAFGYLLLVLGINRWGNSDRHTMLSGSPRSAIYALSLGIFASAWAFYGSVALASWEGLDFFAIYLGPLLLISIGNPLLKRIVQIAKSQNITSIADFVATRYGKSMPVAALVSAIVCLATIPYIGIQLRIVAASYEALTSGRPISGLQSSPMTLVVLAIAIALVTLMLGRKKADEIESRDGLLLAVAFDALIKLAAFLVVGGYIIYGLYGGFSEIFAAAHAKGIDPTLLDRTWPVQDYILFTIAAVFSTLMQPQQFHMMVVENRNISDLSRAAWFSPLYIAILSVVVVPIALAGMMAFGLPAKTGSMAVIALPLQAGNTVIALIAFIGGLSAATVVMAVESIALAIMLSNHVVMPLLMRDSTFSGASAKQRNLSNLVRIIRRCAVLLIIGVALVLQLRQSDTTAQQSVYLIFGAFVQVFPAFIIGLVWARGTALGAMAGMIAGCIVGAYTMFLPATLPDSGYWQVIMTSGPAGLSWLKPTGIFNLGLSNLNNGLVWSVVCNILFYLVFSLVRAPRPLEKIQAAAFIGASETSPVVSFRFFRSRITVGELRGTVTRYLGRERTDRSFASFAHSRNLILNDRDEADLYLLRFAEHLLASVIGAASSRLALTLALRHRTVSTNAALKLLDEASAAIQYSRDLLQYAVDHARQGITVVDKDLTILTWNQAFVALHDLPSGMMHVGLGLDEIVRFNAERGSYGPGEPEQQVSDQLYNFVHDLGPTRLKLFPGERSLEIRTNHLPEGGYVTTYTDVTETVLREDERRRANETLELRVRERTEELTHLNAKLTQAKAEADDANLSKTRFLAAAGHDILQPLNAARLYATSLAERAKSGEIQTLAENVNASLDAVEEILSALLEISRLDTGAMRPNFTDFRIEEILVQLQREFDPVAREKNLQLHFMITRLTIHSDRRLLRRLLQNLISNAIKYTPSGRVLIGARRHGENLSLEVWDTGLGIPESQQKIVFDEFKRLDQGAKVARGLGLGLSIVERISKVLGHRIDLVSQSGRGSVFKVQVAIAANVPVVPQPLEEQKVPSTPLAGMRILAIDNEPVILDGMKILLRGWGCDIVTASGIGDARERMAETTTPFDGVIADYHLDDGDGLQAIGVMRDLAEMELLAILATADRSPAVREMAANNDVQILNKPLKPAALRALLGQWRISHSGTIE